MTSNFYVYLHKDKDGNIFYVGKGIEKRAWSKDRHPIWIKYVEEKLNGQYFVEIYQSNLTEEKALSLEADLINEHGKKLVNWMNPGRDFDIAAIAEYHKQRDANRSFVNETKSFEQTDPQMAIERYKKALKIMKSYESITLERGLVAELNTPSWGDYHILNRLISCLVKEKRYAEAIHEAETYFKEFPTVLELAAGQKILGRISKLKQKHPQH